MEESSKFRKYTAKPATDRDARIQGVAMVRAILNDSQHEIIKSIARCPHSVDQRCQMVHTMLRDEKADTDVVFTIATWCILGGNIASTWAVGENGHKVGKNTTLTHWGGKMIAELVFLGRTVHFDFDLCKPFVTGKIFKSTYNYDMASWYWENRLPKPERVVTVKHEADFPPDSSGPAKRRKTTTASGQSQQRTDLQTANEPRSNDMDMQPEEATTKQAEVIGSCDSLLADLSREQLEAMYRDLRSKNEILEKQSAANLSSMLKHSEKASALEDLVKKASKDSAGTLDLVRAGVDLRKDNDHWECVISAKNLELRQLDRETSSLKQGISNLRDERAILSGEISYLRDEKETLEGRVRALDAEFHDKETLLAENTRLRVDLEASKQETAQVKRWLNDVEVETTTRVPGIDVVRKSTMNLKGVSESLEDEALLGSMGSSGVKGHKHG